MSGQLRLLRSLCDAVAVGAALYLIAGKFPAEVMLADTVTNGGDMGTHYYAAQYMRDVLLPKGAVAGWCPGNYCGFPLFQFYFFFPFLLIALLSHAIPLTIAFKLITVLGTFLLPICAYGAARVAGEDRFDWARSLTPASRRYRPNSASTAVPSAPAHAHAPSSRPSAPPRRSA